MDGAGSEVSPTATATTNLRSVTADDRRPGSWQPRRAAAATMGVSRNLGTGPDSLTGGRSSAHPRLTSKARHVPIPAHHVRIVDKEALAMADRSELAGRPIRAPMPARTRKRWAAAGGVAGLWMLLLVGTHSIVGGTALVLLIAALAIGGVLTLRCFGIDRDHPWVQRAATRPWRDGRDVLQLALRRLNEVFVITPSGALAPNLVELRMNPADVASLTQLMELEVINSSASELYEGKVAAHGARLAGAGPVEVGVIADPAVPVGRYRLKQGRRANAGRAVAGNGLAPHHDGRVQVTQSVAPTLATDVMTVAAPSPVPLLRLVTKGCVAETRVSGARAGRGSDVELPLPDEPTVSRVHAEFTFAEGEWRITSLGRNGVLVNEMPFVDEHPIRHGDSIRWGAHSGALVSKVEVS